MTKCVEEQNGITEKSCVEILEKYFYNILLTLKYAWLCHKWIDMTYRIFRGKNNH